MKRIKSIWYDHQDPDLWRSEYPKGSMYDFLFETANAHLNNCAIEFEGKKLTYKKLLNQIDNVSASLLAIGIKKGDRVSLISANIPQAVISIYAINKIGAIANLVHPLLSPDEIEKILINTESSAVIILDMVYPKIKNISWPKECVPKIILAKISDALPSAIKPIYLLKNKLNIEPNPKHDIITWKKFISLKNKKTNIDSNNSSSDDTAIIMYSGGTTGVPKGVMLTNMNFNSFAVQAYDINGVSDLTGKKSLALLPFFHGFGLGTGLHSTLCSGLHVYLVPKFDFIKSTNLIFKKKINCLYAVPALYEAILRSPQIEKQNISFFLNLISGGDKLSEKLYNKFEKHLKNSNSSTVFCDGYGQTECVSGCITNPYFAVNPKSVGILQPDMSAKIVEPGTHNEVPNGTDGELCINGPTVMKGYYKNEEETKKALQIHEDGKIWLHTGDMFSRDDDGYFYFKQRISRMAISSGYNIYVTEVEKVINSCPVVAQSCVVGVKDKILGQRIVAHVVLNNTYADKDKAKDKIMEKCRASLAEYSLPHEIRFKSELPMTNLGKVNFKALEEEK